jgi:outer membrane protein
MTAFACDTRRGAKGGVLLAIIMAAAPLFHAPAAHAESIKEALTSAYLFNPTLKAARSGVRATDENVPLARSNFRPTVNGTITGGYEDSSTSPGSASSGRNYPKTYSVNLKQPVFRGFRSINAVSGAEASVESARENLRYTESTVFLQAATAYVNVFRDMTILKVFQYNQKVLEQQLRAAQDRFRVGEVTKTDVAQAQAAVSGAISQVNIARQNLDSNRAATSIHRQRAHRRDRPGIPAALTEPGARRSGAENPQVLAIFQGRAQEYR